MDWSPPGSSVHGILQASMLEWVAIAFSRGSSNPGIELRSPALKAASLPSEPAGKPSDQPTKKKKKNWVTVKWKYRLPVDFTLVGKLFTPEDN